MSNTIAETFRFYAPLVEARNKEAKEMRISKTLIMEIAQLELLIKRNARLSPELLEKYKMFFGSLKN